MGWQRTQDCGSCNAGSIPAESTLITSRACAKYMFNEMQQSQWKNEFGPAGLDNAADKNKFRLDGILNGLDKYIDFYDAYWTKRIGDTSKYGFDSNERESMRNTGNEIKKYLENFIKENKIEINPSSNLQHILGNEVLMTAGAIVNKFEKNKKPVTVKEGKRIKEKMDCMNFYLKEILANGDITEQELTAEKGYLEHCARFFNGELPTQSYGLLLLFRFFRELQSGEIKEKDLEMKIVEMEKRFKDNGIAIDKDWPDYLNLDEIRKEFFNKDNLN